MDTWRCRGDTALVGVFEKGELRSTCGNDCGRARGQRGAGNSLSKRPLFLLSQVVSGMETLQKWLRWPQRWCRWKSKRSFGRLAWEEFLREEEEGGGCEFKSTYFNSFLLLRAVPPENCFMPVYSFCLPGLHCSCPAH